MNISVVKGFICLTKQAVLLWSKHGPGIYPAPHALEGIDSVP